MEFLVEFDVTIPHDAPESEVNERLRAEATAAAGLARALPPPLLGVSTLRVPDPPPFRHPPVRDPEPRAGLDLSGGGEREQCGGLHLDRERACIAPLALQAAAVVEQVGADDRAGVLGGCAQSG